MNKKLNCILLVDDDEATNFLNTAMINRMEIANHVYQVYDGQEALDYILQEGFFKDPYNQYPTPDLIILDLNMTHMDGFTFLEKYHRLPSQLQNGHVILLSTSDDAKDRKKAKSFPSVQTYLVKPIRKETWFALAKAYSK